MVRNAGSLPPTSKDFGCKRVQYFKVTSTVPSLYVIHSFADTTLHKAKGCFNSGENQAILSSQPDEGIWYGPSFQNHKRN